MRALLWIGLFAVVMVGIAVPAVYFRAAHNLPQMDTEYDLLGHLKMSVEGERLSYRVGLAAGSDTHHQFVKPELAQFPQRLTTVYLSQLGCPAFLQTPREEGRAWAWRCADALNGTFYRGDPDGSCEWYLLQRLVAAVGIPAGVLENVIAVNKLHGYLSREQMLAWDLAVTQYDRGVVGVADAARALYGRELASLDLATLAELALVLPPNYFWSEVKTCKNDSLLRRSRDRVLDLMAAQQVETPAAVQAAQKLPLACGKVP